MSETANQEKPKAPGRELTPAQEKFNSIRGLLDRAKSQIALALPKHMTPERMTRVALTALSRQPLLLECTPESFVLAMLSASAMGLEPDGRLGHLIPYRNRKNQNRYEAQFQADYKGLVDIAYRSGLVRLVSCGAVREGDTFEYTEGTGGFVKHRRDLRASDEQRGELYAAWAQAELPGGAQPFVVLSKADVMRRRRSSQAGDSEYSPWNTHPDSMWKKSAVKELCKFIPSSPELNHAIIADDAAEMGERPPAIDATFLDLGEARNGNDGSPGTKSAVLAAKLKAAAGEKAAQQAPDRVGDTAAASLERKKEDFKRQLAEAQAREQTDEHAGQHATEHGGDATIESSAGETVATIPSEPMTSASGAQASNEGLLFGDDNETPPWGAASPSSVTPEEMTEALVDRFSRCNTFDDVLGIERDMRAALVNHVLSDPKRVVSCFYNAALILVPDPDRLATLRDQGNADFAAKLVAQSEKMRLGKAFKDAERRLGVGA